LSYKINNVTNYDKSKDTLDYVGRKQNM